MNEFKYRLQYAACLVCLVACCTGCQQTTSPPADPTKVSQATKDAVDSFLNAIKETGRIKNDDREKILALPADELLSSLQQYIYSGDLSYETQSLSLIYHLYEKSADAEIKKRCVDVVLEFACSDKSDAFPIKWLKKVPREMFPDSVTVKMSAAIRGGKQGYDFILLAGCLNIKELKGEFTKMAQAYYEGKKDIDKPCGEWAATITMARWGDEKALSIAIDVLGGYKSDGYGGDMTKANRLADELKYIDRPESVRLLVQNVLSKDWLGLGVGGDVVAMPFGAHSACCLAGMIEAPPVRPMKNLEWILGDDLAKFRTWLMEQSKLVMAETGEQVDISDIVRKAKEQN